MTVWWPQTKEGEALKEAVELLRDHIPKRYGFAPGYCLWCGRLPFANIAEKHEDGCQLDAFLKRWGEK